MLEITLRKLKHYLEDTLEIPVLYESYFEWLRKEKLDNQLKPPYILIFLFRFDEEKELRTRTRWYVEVNNEKYLERKPVFLSLNLYLNLVAEKLTDEIKILKRISLLQREAGQMVIEDTNYPERGKFLIPFSLSLPFSTAGTNASSPNLRVSTLYIQLENIPVFYNKRIEANIIEHILLKIYNKDNEDKIYFDKSLE